MGAFYMSSQSRLSAVSVVFDFNASLNAVAPVSLISLPVYVKRKGKKCSVDGCLLCLLFLFTA